MITVVWIGLFLIVAVLCWLVNFGGLPGNWILVGVAGVYTWMGPADPPYDMSWMAFAILVGFALLGEILEFVAGLLGASQAGASRRGAMMSLVGSIAGGILGLMVGLPIPVIGSLAAAVLFASLGALGGGLLGELWIGRTWDEGMRVGHGAFWGRLCGTLGKVLCSTLMLITAVFTVFF